MTQSSLPWAGTSPGSAGPYTDIMWAAMQAALFTADPTTECVLPVSTLLAVSNPSGSTIRVAPGFALVAGRFYTNDANYDSLSVATPGAGDNYYTVVLRNDYTAQTTLIAILGPNTSSYPAGTQNASYWEVAIGRVQVTSGGAITVTIPRCFAHFSTMGLHLIAELNGDESSDVSFANIPQNYQHLLMLCQISLNAVGSGYSGIYMTFNGDTGAHYNSLYNDQIVSSVYQQISEGSIHTSMTLGAFPSGSATQSGIALILIPNYKSILYKLVLVLGASEDGAGSPVTIFEIGTWASTSSVSSIQGSFFALGHPRVGSLISLYGIG